MTIQYDNTNTQISAVGSTANIPIVFQTKGTGALDFSAGSTGINISNGNTLTAITRTAAGGSYTSAPAIAISAPQIAGGTTATATCTLGVISFSLTSGGTGYTLNDVLTLVGGTFNTSAQFTVTGVSGGVITTISATNAGAYTTSVPTNPASTTGGTGSGATITVSSWGINSAFSITNAGSGYVEQPTVTFSGGGGSGAAAYASIGSGAVIRSLGSTGTQSLSFFVPSGEVLRLRDTGTSGTYMMVNTTNSGANLVAQGTTNAFFGFNSNGTGALAFGTNGNTGNTQMQVTHTASAVNYVQVTGAATTGTPVISAQGSDTNVNIAMVSKGTGSIRFFTNGVVSEHFRIIHTAGTIVNYATVTGNVAGSAPIFSVAGTDTNINLTLTPKGTGRVQFGTHTATADTAISGYIEILDSGGTVRRLAVIT